MGSIRLRRGKHTLLAGTSSALARQKQLTRWARIRLKWHRVRHQTWAVQWRRIAETELDGNRERSSAPNARLGGPESNEIGIGEVFRAIFISKVWAC